MSTKGAGQEAESIKAEVQGENQPAPSNLVMRKLYRPDWQCDLEAMKYALSNELILESILKNLQTRDLIQYRLITSGWNRAVTNILRNRRDAYVKVAASTDIDALEKCIKNSAGFPFREIRLQFTGKDFQNEPEKWLQLGLFRPFSSLFARLGLDCSEVPGTFVAGLLTGPFNGVVSLTLYCVELDPFEENLFQDRRNLLRLSKMKTITFETGCQNVDQAFLIALLQSCPNLDKIENIAHCYLPAVSSASKLEAVKSVRLCCHVSNNKDYPTPSQVEIEKLTICYHEDDDSYRVEFSSLQPLLESSRGTLERISVYAPIVGGKNSDKWPRLKNLTSLELWQSFEFPDSVEDIFPALESIRLDALEGVGYDICDFIWKEPLSTVTKLDVFFGLSHKEWASLSAAIPNVRRILTNERGCDIYNPDEDNWLHDPWGGPSHFEQLETLCITPITLAYYYLDFLLTGIPEPCLKIMRANPGLPVPPLEFVDVVLRGNRKRLAALSGLKELVLPFTVRHGVTKADLKPEHRITPHLFRQYAINSVMPKDLKICFLYDHWSETAELMEEALESVSDFVTFGHWNAQLQDEVVEEGQEETKEEEKHYNATEWWDH